MPSLPSACPGGYRLDRHQSSFAKDPQRPTHGPPPSVTRDRSHPSRIKAFWNTGNSFLRAMPAVSRCCNVRREEGGDDRTTVSREKQREEGAKVRGRAKPPGSNYSGGHRWPVVVWRFPLKCSESTTVEIDISTHVISENLLRNIKKLLASPTWNLPPKIDELVRPCKMLTLQNAQHDSYFMSALGWYVLR